MNPMFIRTQYITDSHSSGAVSLGLPVLGLAVMPLLVVPLLASVMPYLAATLTAIALTLTLLLVLRREGISPTTDWVLPVRSADSPDHVEPDAWPGRTVLTPAKPLSIPIMLGMLVALWFFAQLIGGWVLAHLPHEDMLQYQQKTSQFGPLQMLVLGVILAPLLEELLMRGLGYGFLRHQIPPMLSALLVSVVFSIGHGTLMHLPLTFILSMMVCFFMESHRSLSVAILAHMGFNLLSALAPETMIQFILTAGSNTIVAMVAALGAVGLLVLLGTMTLPRRKAAVTTG